MCCLSMNVASFRHVQTCTNICHHFPCETSIYVNSESGVIGSKNDGSVPLYHFYLVVAQSVTSVQHHSVAKYVAK